MLTLMNLRHLALPQYTFLSASSSSLTCACFLFMVAVREVPYVSTSMVPPQQEGRTLPFSAVSNHVRKHVLQKGVWQHSRVTMVRPGVASRQEEQS